MSATSIYDQLRAAGMTKEGACALFGNMVAESALRSDNAQNGYGIDDKIYTMQADTGDQDFASDGIGYGLCQWTKESRKTKLLYSAKAQGVSVGDETMQVQFCIRELQDDFPGVWDELTSSYDLDECTKIVMDIYENPKIKNFTERLHCAQLAMEFFPDDASDACPIFPPDPSVMVIQMVMGYNGYWGKPDGQKSQEFFDNLRTFVNDMEKC